MKWRSVNKNSSPTRQLAPTRPPDLEKQDRRTVPLSHKLEVYYEYFGMPTY